MTGCISQKDTILTVDVGNTSIVFGLFTEGILAFTERISTQKEADAFFYSKQIQTIIHKRNLEKHIIIHALIYMSSSIVLSFPSKLYTSMPTSPSWRPLFIYP